MDFGTLFGLLASMWIIYWSITEGGSSLGLFLDPHPIIIVIGGSAAVTIMKFGLKPFFSAFRVALHAFVYKKYRPEAIIQEAIDVAETARKGGLLSLENVEIKDAFLKKGVSLLVDGYDQNVIREILMKEMNLTLERHHLGQKVFRAIAEAGPALGMIGTLLGLVQMMSNMKDPKAIGPAMAIALLATFYGAVMANMIALPIAEKLALRSSEERISKSLVIDAIKGIQAGQNPRVIEQGLQNYLPRSKRKIENENAA